MAEKTISVLNVSKTLVNVLGTLLLPNESTELADTAENRATVKTDALKIVTKAQLEKQKSEEKGEETSATGNGWQG